MPPPLLGLGNKNDLDLFHVLCNRHLPKALLGGVGKDRGANKSLFSPSRAHMVLIQKGENILIKIRAGHSVTPSLNQYALTHAEGICFSFFVFKCPLQAEINQMCLPTFILPWASLRCY